MACGRAESVFARTRRVVRSLLDARRSTVVPDARDRYVVLGHSLGAWMAFEVVHELEKRGLPTPLALIVSGARAPQLHDPQLHDQLE